MNVIIFSLLMSSVMVSDLPFRFTFIWVHKWGTNHNAVLYLCCLKRLALGVEGLHKIIEKEGICVELVFDNLFCKRSFQVVKINFLSHFIR